MSELAAALINAVKKSNREVVTAIASGITNIRYGDIKGDTGTILFNYRGATHSIPEPMDVLLVGWDDTQAARWIANKYLVELT